MTKQSIGAAAVRIFGGSGTQASQRPTVDTPCGTIYSGTPEADAYFETKAWSDRLTALSKSLETMLADKAQTVAEIADLLPLIPDSDARTVATLKDLSEALQGRVTSHAGMRFRDAAQAYAAHVVDLRNHAERAAFGLGVLGDRAPRPPHPSQGPAQDRTRAGSWYSQHGDD